MSQNITEKEITEMIGRYNAGKATAAEQAFVDAYYDYFDKDVTAADLQLGEEMKSTILARITQPPVVVRLRPFYKYAIAACLVIISGISAYTLLISKNTETAGLVMKNDIVPGGNLAVLTLSSGQKIVLNSQQGHIASQGKTAIALTKGGRLSYSNTGGKDNALLNTLTIPAGNRRDITLADGTEVSLDAGSSLTFPVAFNGNERSVTLTGQGYFKVKHDSRHPFRVRVNELTILDLGTEFNINSYLEERAVQTTLFEGSLKVNNILLKPGQMALAATAHEITLAQADLDAIGAWRNNDFVFHNQDLRTTMMQISRWYNVKVIYEHAPEELHIQASISRNRNLSAVLQLIQETGEVKFRIEGRTVTVSQ